MRTIQTTTAFNKAIKKVQKYNNFKKSKFDNAITQLQNKGVLDATFKDHKAAKHSEGNWKGSKMFHVAPDIVVVYQLTDDSVILQGIGSHADLFEMLVTV